MAALQLCERPVVLFDFDGTVADTGRAVMTSTRKTLAARGFSEAQMGDLRRMTGPPLWKSFHDFYGFTREESLVVADEYRAFFDELGPEEYPVFDGIPELLDGLAAQGKRMAVATSRMEAKCIDMVHELGLCQFEAVVGMNPPQGRETKADSVRDALAALGATADGAGVIGDRFNASCSSTMWRARTRWACRVSASIRARRHRGSTRPRAPMRWCTRWPSLLNFSLYKYVM